MDECLNDTDKLNETYDLTINQLYHEIQMKINQSNIEKVIEEDHHKFGGKEAESIDNENSVHSNDSTLNSNNYETEIIFCMKCFLVLDSDDGILLRKCLHTFCMNCFSDALKEQGKVFCPAEIDNMKCLTFIQEKIVEHVPSIAKHEFEVMVPQLVKRIEFLEDRVFCIETSIVLNKLTTDETCIPMASENIETNQSRFIEEIETSNNSTKENVKSELESNNNNKRNISYQSDENTWVRNLAIEETNQEQHISPVENLIVGDVMNIVDENELKQRIFKPQNGSYSTQTNKQESEENKGALPKSSNSRFYDALAKYSQEEKDQKILADENPPDVVENLPKEEFESNLNDFFSKDLGGFIIRCKKPDCNGGGFIEANEKCSLFVCPTCNSYNCRVCHAIHTGMTCVEYKNGENNKSKLNEKNIPTFSCVSNFCELKNSSLTKSKIQTKNPSNKITYVPNYNTSNQSQDKASDVYDNYLDTNFFIPNKIPVQNKNQDNNEEFSVNDKGKQVNDKNKDNKTNYQPNMFESEQNKDMLQRHSYNTRYSSKQESEKGNQMSAENKKIANRNESTKKCLHCNETKAKQKPVELEVYQTESFRPGEWICDGCKYKNITHKHTCQKCFEPKEKYKNEALKQIPIKHELNFGKTVQNSKMREWKCEKCKFVNKTDSIRCDCCGKLDERRSHLLKIQEDLNSASKKKQMKLESELEQQRIKGSQSNISVESNEAFEWKCDHCTSVNTKHSYICDVCSKTDEKLFKMAKKQEEVKSSYKNKPNNKKNNSNKCEQKINADAKTWTCIFCTFENFKEQATCEGCQKRNDPTKKFTFKCLNSECVGFCAHDENATRIKCPQCGIKNCLQCKAIHPSMNCEQYQKTAESVVKCPDCGIALRYDKTVGKLICFHCENNRNNGFLLKVKNYFQK